MWPTDLNIIPCVIVEHRIPKSLPLICYFNSFSSFQETFRIIWNLAAAISSHLATWALVMFGDKAWFTVSVPVHLKGVNSIEVRVCAGFFINSLWCRPVKFFSSKPNKNIVILKEEKIFPKVLPQSWKHTKVFSEISFHGVALGFTVTRTKETLA